MLTLGQLVEGQNVTIESLATQPPTISGNSRISRVFEISAAAHVTLDNLNLIDGVGVADDMGSSSDDGNRRRDP